MILPAMRKPDKRLTERKCITRQIAERLSKPMKWVQNQKTYANAPIDSVESFLRWLAEAPIRKAAKESEREIIRRIKIPMHREKAKVRSKVYRARPDVKARQSARQRRDRHKTRAWEQAKLRTDPAYKLRKYLRKKLRQALAESRTLKSESALKLVGCTLLELRSHLANQFKRGMSWDNYGKWHVDHIIPISKFNLSDPEHQRRCFHYLNLQPLWAVHNIQKGDTISEPAQIPLGLAA